MPANDELSGADPYAAFASAPTFNTSTAPDKDTSFSNALAHEQAPHNIPGDGSPNAAFGGTAGKPAQYPLAEQAVRNAESTSTP